MAPASTEASLQKLSCARRELAKEKLGEGAKMYANAADVKASSTSTPAVRALVRTRCLIPYEGIETGLAKAKIDLLHGLALVKDEHTVSYTDGEWANHMR